MKPIRSCKTGGFTLIEVLIALAILGSAAFVLMKAHYGALNLFDSAREQMELNDLITRVVGLAEVQVASEVMSGSEEFGKRHPNWRYRFEAEEVSPESPGLVRVDVFVEQPDRKKEYVVTLLTFVPKLAERALQSASSITNTSLSSTTNARSNSQNRSSSNATGGTGQ